MTKMLFDQYSRYRACADIVSRFSDFSSVVDVGSGPECLLGQFLPTAEITFVDPLLEGHAAQDERKIAGDIDSPALKAKRFGVACCIDALEHVPPPSRKAFVERLSSLAEAGLVLAFPSQESAASCVDQQLSDVYRTVYHTDYSWLEEHHRYGLPSLEQVRAQLEELGWQVTVLGHGHAPWLETLLGAVICGWEAEAARPYILSACEKFNTDLYPYDFVAPHYRHFVIAHRGNFASDPGCLAKMDDVAECAFADVVAQLHGMLLSVMKAQREKDVTALQAKLDDALQRGGEAEIERNRSLADKYQASIALAKVNAELAQMALARDVAAAAYQQAVVERDRVQSERDGALADAASMAAQLGVANAERDRLRSELRAAQELIAQVRLSRSWRITRPLRVMARVMRHGWQAEDSQRVQQALRRRYHNLPLPQPVRRVLGKLYRSLSRSMMRPRRPQAEAQALQRASIALAGQQMGRPDYCVWGIIDWHFRHQRPQQLALALAATGRRVFYISPNFIDSPQAGFEVEPLDAAGHLFQVRLFAHGAPLIYYGPPSVELIAQLRSGIGEVLAWAGSTENVALVDHPYWCDVAAAQPNSRLIYDCMDHHEGFGNNAEGLLQLERRLLQSAELTITTSSWLDQAVAHYAPQRLLLRNAAEYEHFSAVPDQVYRDAEGRQVIGYYGAIAEWFDVDLVAAIARRFPDCLLLLIGADTIQAKSRLGRLANVRFVGEVPYAELPYYLHGFDVCLLPFKVIPLTQATNPVKVYEYLAAGKPVVAVDLPEMAQFEGLVRVAQGHAAFLDQLQAQLQEAGNALASRQSFASEQTWKHRAECLIQHVEDPVRDPLVSVIVVTYNNLDLTRACLESLERYSQYPNLEIIVVDNASSDGSQEFLTRWQVEQRGRRLILNEDNRGFAAANNQGLAMAAGAYLVLLNNDTYVTPGWVRTLMRHLQRNPRLGLIGPVTNNIGNEARVDIEYADMNGMLAQAAAYTCRHVGQTYPLQTAAFFCVMLPRAVYERIGPLDEAFGRGFFEDDDYCRRVQAAGLEVRCADDVFVHHHLSASFSQLKQQERQKLFEENKRLYESKWGAWVPHGYRQGLKPAPEGDAESVAPFIAGHCNTCGKPARFHYVDPLLWRESLLCEHCKTTSRYRSIARGVLRAINERFGMRETALSGLSQGQIDGLRVYDTQPPFYYHTCAYPLPDQLKAGGVEVALSQYKPALAPGAELAVGVTNQNLEALTFPDAHFDIVITSDVMEHVRLDDLAHREIHRVLKPGGVYLFTVPHDRSRGETLTRVQVVDPANPSSDVHVLEPEYHGDTNSDDGDGVLSYRVYGRQLELQLQALGFEVDYSREDLPGEGIMSTELYYCKKINSQRAA